MDLNAPQTSTRPTFIKLGGDVLVLSKGQWYAGRIVQENHENREGRQGILIHYKGWGKRHDEAVYEDEFETRIKESTPETFAEAVIRGRVNKHQAKKRAFPKSKDDGDQPSDGNDDDDGESDSESERVRPKNKRKKPTKFYFNDAKYEEEIVLPRSLKKILVDDQDYINRQFQICHLPARETVSKIIDDVRFVLRIFILQYCQEIRETGQEEITVEYIDDEVTFRASELIQNAMGIKNCFDCLLPTQLLYKHERLRFEQLRQELLAEQMNAAKNPEVESTSENQGESSQKADDAPHPIPPGFKVPAAEYYGLPHLLRLLSKLESYLNLPNLDSTATDSVIKTSCDFLLYLKKHRKTLMAGMDYESTTNEYQRETFA